MKTIVLSAPFFRLSGYKWVPCSIYASMPPNAVVGGNDSDGDVMFVGRSDHNGEMLVAKIVPAKQIAFVSTRGEALPKDNFEVLCGGNLVWRQCHDHVIPENAIVCGNTSLGQPVYIGRGRYENSLTVGRVSSVHRALFIPFRGVERRLVTYEVLVEEGERAAGWFVPSATPLPAPPPPFELEMKPELIDPTKMYPPLDRKPPLYTPMPMPQPPPFVGCTPAPAPFDPPPPYPCDPFPPVCVPHRPPPPPPPRPHDLWVSATTNNMPRYAVHAGHEANMSTIFVCRAFHKGALLPGKVVPNHGYAYVSFAGQEVPKASFEVLVGEGAHIWIPASNGSVAPGAVEAGRSSSGEPLFVGRAHFCGSLTPGRIEPSHQCLYIPFGGHEKRLTNYEVLVRKDLYYQQQGMHMSF